MKQSTEEYQHKAVWISSALLRWFRTAARPMAWRETRDPYRIWVSEIMLQQTRVATVAPYYERFLLEFPDVETLSRAPLDAVLKAWEGLGYYSRARNLHRAAGILVARHGAKVPRTVEALEELPGIGRSTAGAIAAIAFGADVPILDANARRVVARLFAVQGDPRSSSVENVLWERSARPGAEGEGSGHGARGDGPGRHRLSAEGSPLPGVSPGVPLFLPPPGASGFDSSEAREENAPPSRHRGRGVPPSGRRALPDASPFRRTPGRIVGLPFGKARPGGEP